MQIFEANLLLWVIPLSLLVGALAFYHLARWWRKLRLRRRFSRGAVAEQRANKILKNNGYEVLFTQRPFVMRMYVDNQLKEYKIRPDAFAKKNGRLYIVEVKTGQHAANPLYRDTRRQLMEYYYGIAADGLLLVNGDAETIHHIDFAGSIVSTNSKKSYLFVFILGVVLTSLVFTAFTLGWFQYGR